MPLKIAALIAAGTLTLVSAAASASGVILIDQSTVMASGGFPFKITEPGSYQLKGNLVVTAADTAIAISVGNVTLDLNGFSITGPGPTVGLYGVANSNAVTAVSVRNGTISGFSYGINLGGPTSPKGGVTGAIVQNMTVYDNGVGISTGPSSLVSGNVATGNTSEGIQTNRYSTITGNTVTSNGSIGIGTECPSNLVGNIAVGNKDNFAAPLTVITVPPCTFNNNNLP